jgi:hypothetical protein
VPTSGGDDNDIFLFALKLSHKQFGSILVLITFIVIAAIAARWCLFR